jgi:hypothetical protein
MADRPPRDRYLPFNLCTVVPFEATAAALRLLPTVQPRAPAAPNLLPELSSVDTAPLDAETRALVLDILAETARQPYVALHSNSRPTLQLSPHTPTLSAVSIHTSRIRTSP